MGLVAQQTPKAFLGKALLPAPHHRPIDANPIDNLKHRWALGGQQDDLRPLNMLPRAPSVFDDPFQVRAILSRQEKRDGLSHSSRLARPCPSVNPPFASARSAVQRPRPTQNFANTDYTVYISTIVPAFQNLPHFLGG
jgi:hypothetical protein